MFLTSTRSTDGSQVLEITCRVMTATGPWAVGLGWAVDRGTGPWALGRGP